MLFDKLGRFLIEGMEAGLLKMEVNMFNIFKRKDSPYYYIDFSIDGARIKISTRCTSRQAVEQALKQVLITAFQKIQNPEMPGTIPLFKEVSAEFVQYQKNRLLKSWKREELCHRTLLSYLGNKRIDEISPNDLLIVLQNISNRKKRGGKQISPRSVDYIRGYLHRLFEHAKNVKGYVEKNPVENIRKIKYNNRRTRIISPDEFRELVKSTEDDLAKDAFFFFVNTGLRLGELISLKKSDFLQGDGFIYFRITREKNGTLTEFPLVLDRLVNIVEKYLSRQGSEYFWVYPDGTPLSKWRILYEFEKAKKKAGIRNLQLKDIRRTFNTRLFQNGCKDLIREYLMGHTLPEIPARYSIFTINDVADEIKRIKEKLEQFCPSYE